jgi:hypothetical protein
MPWYYAGPEAKPVGPLSAEQLHALRASGTISTDTFIIEHTGTGAANLAWKRYGELFPATPVFPPVPAVPAPVPAVPPAPLPAAAIPAPHPLFPSAGPSAAAHPVFPAGTIPAAYSPLKPTNGWCAWGFGLSLIGFFFAFICGIGLIPALISFILCIVGLVQVSRNQTQSGQGLAIGGLIFSGIGLLVAIGLISWFMGPILKAHGITVTEQTSNDSE